MMHSVMSVTLLLRPTYRIASNYGLGIYSFKVPIARPKVALNLRLIAIKGFC